MMHFAATRHTVSRDRAVGNRRHWDSYWIYRENGIGVMFEHAGREFVTHIGDVVITDADATLTQQPSADLEAAGRRGRNCRKDRS